MVKLSSTDVRDREYCCSAELNGRIARSIHSTSCFAEVEFLVWDVIPVMVDHIVWSYTQSPSVFSYFFPPTWYQTFRKVNACLVVGEVGYLYSQLQFSLAQGTVCSEGVAASINCVFLVHIVLVCLFC